MTEDEIFGEPVHVYTRAQALADGVLVDVTEWARETGFRFPVAMTRAAWADCVGWTETDDDRKGGIGQDERGRAHDVLWMAFLAVKRAAETDRATFQLLRTPREGRGRAPKLATLVIVCGPGDDASPVLTIMLPGED